MSAWVFYVDALFGINPSGLGNWGIALGGLWAAVFGLGLMPRRWVTLEVEGRRSGRLVRFPLGMADWHGQWYLVSMLGGQRHWVQNARARDGRATIRRRRAVRSLPPGGGAGERARRNHQALAGAGARRPPAHPGGPARAAG